MWSINVLLGLLRTDVEFMWWGLHSNFLVQPNCSVEAVLCLCCVVVGVVVGAVAIVITRFCTIMVKKGFASFMPQSNIIVRAGK